MSMKHAKTAKGLSRRAVLKGAAGLAGAAAGSGAITGFPAVWSQEEKVLRYLGTAVNQSKEIAQNITGVADAARDTSRGASQTQAAATELAQMATKMRAVVQQFRLPEAG